MRGSSSESGRPGAGSSSRLVIGSSLVALTLTLAACSPGGDRSNGNVAQGGSTAQRGSAPSAATHDTAGTPPVSAASSESSRAGNGLTRQGLGDLRIGVAVPKGGTWAERGAQASDACRTVSSPQYPGVYAIVTEGKVQRITIGQRSDLAANGVRIGTSEQEVKKRFTGLVEALHKYEAPPAKYLTSAEAANGSPAFRFEIGQDGKVKLIHAGLMPVLAYVEGCA